MCTHVNPLFCYLLTFLLLCCMPEVSQQCADTEIAGTLLIKYLFFLLGLCIALCTLACAVIFLTHSTPDGHHSRFCFCFPTSQAYANRIRAFVGLEPLPEDPAGIRQLSRHMRDADTILTSARRGSSRESFRDIYGRQLGNSSARSEHLWSPREVPVLHGVVRPSTTTGVFVSSCLGSQVQCVRWPKVQDHQRAALRKVRCICVCLVHRIMM